MENDNGTFSQVSEDAEIESLMENGIKLKITGVIKPNEDNETALINSVFGYTKALTDYLIEYINESAVVKAQKENSKINVLNGITFEPEDDKAKINDVKTYVENMGVIEKSNLYKMVLQSAEAEQAQNQENAGSQKAPQGMENPQMQPTEQVQEFSESDLAAKVDEYMKNPDNEILLAIYAPVQIVDGRAFISSHSSFWDRSCSFKIAYVA